MNVWYSSLRKFALVLGALSALVPLHAAAFQTSEELRSVAQAWAQSALASAVSDSAVALRMDVQVGQVDARLKLAACGNVEPYMPPGSRLWGTSRLGLRCVDGMSKWSITLPVLVNAFGPAWVVREPVASGTVLTESNAVKVEVNWAQEASPVLQDKGQWLGQTATRALGTGQTLRQGMVRPAQVFQAGMQVRVVAQGAGFQVSAEAQSLSAGVVGQLARVRMENGRVSTGTVLDAHTVRIDI